MMLKSEWHDDEMDYLEVRRCQSGIFNVWLVSINLQLFCLDKAAGLGINTESSEKVKSTEKANSTDF